MKVKGKVKRLFSAIGLACASVACATVGLIGLERAPVANADVATETTHFSGIRSSTVNTIYLYWRTDGANLEAPSAKGIAVDWYGSGDTTPETKYIKLTYDTVAAQNRLNVGSTILRNNEKYAQSAAGAAIQVDHTALKSAAPVIKIDWFNDEACELKFNAVSGDTFTVQSGTSFASSTVSYVLDQDYTFSFNGASNGWALTEETHIPVSLSGARSGSAAGIYAYGFKEMDNYVYAYHDGTTSGYSVLVESMSLDYYASEGADVSTVTARLEYVNTDSENRIDGVKQFEPTLQITFTSGSVATGSRVVLPKGTMMDNYVVDRDYSFTWNGSVWSMDAATSDADSTMTLTSRGANLKDGTGIYFFTKSVLPFAVDERFAKNTVVYVNNEPVYTDRFAGLKQSGDNYSFGLFFKSACAVGDTVKLPDGMYIAGYRLDGVHYFKYNGTTDGWTKVACDGTNHIFNDDYTCHDRECACGEVSKATDDHTFENDTFVCQERVCTTCGDTVAAVDHTFASGTYACQDRVCTVCSQNVDGDPTAHVPAGSGCEQTCENCQETLSVHEFPQVPAEGWTADNDAVTVGTAPDCINKGTGTVKCNNCDATDEVELNALGHNVPDGEKYCNRGDCDYRIPYTEADMEEILALNNLANYTYSDSHPVDGDSTLGSLNRTPDAENENLHSNDFLINAAKGESGYAYEQGKESVHNMTVSFSVTLTEWAADDRSSYVWLNAHENGSWGIGFMFCFYQGAQNLRVIYKPTDGKEVKFVDVKALTGFALNEKQSFKLGVVQNSDGSFFVFAYYNGALFLTGTLSNELLTQYATPASHDGLGGAVAFRFNGNAAKPAALGTICDTACSVEGTQYACKDYQCKICQTVISHTQEHSWGEGEKTGEGSCTKPEEYTKTCGVCGDTATYDGKLVHTWDMDNPTYVQKAECLNMDAIVTYECSLCSATSEQITLTGTGIAGQHNMEYAPVTNATCSAGGTEQGTCTKCGVQEAISDTPIDPDAHVYGTEITGESATCTTDGTKAHYQCTLCEKLFIKEGEVYTQVTADDLVIKAAHTYVKVDAVAATATADGVAEHYKCSVCNKLFTKNGDTYTEVTAADLKVEYVAPESSSDDSSASESSASDSSASDSSEEKSGCGSYTSAVGALACLLLCGAAVTLARKRKN